MAFYRGHLWCLESSLKKNPSSEKREVQTFQPVAPRDSLELLAKFIMEAEVTVAAVEASIIEIRRDFDLL